MPEYTRMGLYKQNSKYDSGPKYTNKLNVTKF